MQQQTEHDFEEATSVVASAAVSGRPALSDDAKLAFYGLFKQATVGDNATPRPNFFDRKGRAKWVAWAELEGMPASEARLGYIELLKQLVPSWKSQEEDQSKPVGTSLGPVISSLASTSESTTLGAGPGPEVGSLHAAAMEGDMDALNAGIAQGLPVNARDPDGCSPLHWAADKGHVQIIRRLAESGADLNPRDSDGQTPLHYAALSEQQQAFLELHQLGAAVDVADNDGQTAKGIAPTQWKLPWDP
ncbi:hypothetical protein WJX74_002919 [Apatococcus lobatus]|uniref:ACB domain-containing protein n=1 Tax=Apatococcus lobatus TaxID=904363 RepID=A0AAW1RGX8_9CHLO